MSFKVEKKVDIHTFLNYYFSLSYFCLVNNHALNSLWGGCCHGFSELRGGLQLESLYVMGNDDTQTTINGLL